MMKIEPNTIAEKVLFDKPKGLRYYVLNKMSEQNVLHHFHFVSCLMSSR